ncbi:MAG: three-Cys-motif partner protein TcmP [Chroococcales cyanobacterium]
MSNRSFFNEFTEQSLVKAEIVSKYFWAWAQVIIPWAKKSKINIAYVDLFSGPGRYKDGSKSTPLKILEQALSDDDMCQKLVTVFNDLDSDNTQSLQEAINDLPDIEKLHHRPQIFNMEVGESIIRELEQLQSVPALFFIDPWGYKGLSLKLIGSVIKSWGCDCIFFFNYNRINMGLSNATVQEHMNSLFGKERADLLREKLEFKRPYERELIILEDISQALKEIGGDYVLPFCFKDATGSRTSHHLIFVSKHVRGYEIMKEIMAKQSSSTEQGVPLFEYNIATQSQPLLFELSKPLDDLTEMLTDKFAGKTMTMKQVYEQHHVGTRYIKGNYKEALKKLEQSGKILANPPANKRRPFKGEITFADKVQVTFPSKNSP